MQIGIASWSLSRSPAVALERATALGFRKVQIDFGQGEDSLGNAGQLRQIEQHRATVGLAISAIGARALNDLGVMDPFAELSCLQLAEKVIMCAQVLAVPLVFFPSFRCSEIKDRSDRKRTARFLKRVCREAASLGITVASENGLGAEGNACLIEEVDQENFKILFDTYNPVLTGNDPSLLLKGLLPWIALDVHVKDGLHGAMGSVPLGRGEAPLQRVFDVVAERRAIFNWFLETKYSEVGYDWVDQDAEWLRLRLTAPRDAESAVAVYPRSNKNRS